MSIYSPLQHRLANAGPEPVTLTFKDIERLIGRPLPRSARDPRIRRQWWANSEVHVQARAWLGAGRRARLVAGADAVTFARDEDVSNRGEVREPARAWKDAPPPGPASLDSHAQARRMAILDWFRTKSLPSESSSADLIREDRDAR